jgi:site-specific recombinase XerD
MEYYIIVLFYTRTSGKSNGEKLPIYLRITVNGQRFDRTINRSVDPAKWSAIMGRMIGNSAEAKVLNNFLDALKNKVHQAEREMILDGKEITFESFKDKWFGVDKKIYMLLEIFKQHNEEVTLLVGKDFAPGTLQRYKTSLDHTRSFIEWKYKLADIDVSKLDYNFISSYALWLKTVRNCNHNSTMKYLANFKKIVLICLKNGWIIKDPFIQFKITKQEVERPILTEQELQTLVSRNFEINRLNLVKDIFIFSCYTGLAYADVQKLKRSEIIIGVDGDKWISTRRQKTDTSSKIPILPIAAALIDKYKDHSQCFLKDRLLPVLTNQKMNAYLKEIADTCGIKKHLTFHIARHTFATTVTLSNGVPIETVSKMLGHTNLRTTQHYAKILDMKVSEDMMLLKKKLLSKSAQ